MAFSGGKDSTVLLDLVRKVYPDVTALFVNTGLEYPELQRFAKGTENTLVVRPKMMFTDVIKTYGYPLISKEVSEAIYYARRLVGGKTTPKKRDELRGARVDDKPNGNALNSMGGDQVSPEPNTLSFRRMGLLGCYPPSKTGGGFSKSQFNKEKWLPLSQLPIPISHYCCNVMKKKPSHDYCRETKQQPYLGVLTEESRMRKQAWLRHGCNAFNANYPSSQPLAFWTEQDILNYIVKFNLPIASVYGDVIANDKGNLECSGCSRTG